MTGFVRYTAPAVRYPFARSVVPHLGFADIGCFWCWCVCLCGSAQGRAGAGLQWTGVLALAAWVIASLCALRYWWCAPSGELVWDGQGWAIHFVADEEPLALRARSGLGGYASLALGHGAAWRLAPLLDLA
jgi:hypothetical protein